MRIEFSHSNTDGYKGKNEFKCGICKSNSHSQRDCRRKDSRGGGDRDRGGDRRGDRGDDRGKLIFYFTNRRS